MVSFSKLNNYGNIPSPATGVHGRNISSQRIDELDIACLNYLSELAGTSPCFWALDIGGGNGAHSKRMANAGANVVLVDLADQQRQIDIFDQTKEKNNSVLFLQKDIRDLDFDSVGNYFHIIYSQRALSCIPFRDFVSLIRKLWDYSVPGARIFVSVGGLGTELGQEYPHRDLPVEKRWSVLSEAMARKHQIIAPECLYTESELTHTLSENGFSIVKSWTSLFGTPKAIARRTQ